MSSLQPEYIAYRGTSGMPTSTDMLGRFQPPDWNTCVNGAAVPVVVGAPNAALSQNQKVSASIGTITSPSAVTASLIGASGSRPKPISSLSISGCSAPSVVLANGIRV